MQSSDPIDLTADLGDLLPQVIIDEWLPNEDRSILFLFQGFNNYPPHPTHYILPPNFLSVLHQTPIQEFDYKHLLSIPPPHFQTSLRHIKMQSKNPHSLSSQSLFNHNLVIQLLCLPGFLTTGRKLDVWLISRSSGRLPCHGSRGIPLYPWLVNSVRDFYRASPPSHGPMELPTQKTLPLYS